MKSTESRYPIDGIGRLAGFLFLALIPFVTLIPVTPVPVWLTQDLILRWASVFLFLLCLFAYFYHARSRAVFLIELDFPNILLLFMTGWLLLSANQSQQRFDSFYAFKSFFAMALFWFSTRMIWDRWPGVFPRFEKIFLGTAVIASGWLIISTWGHLIGIPFFVNYVIPRQGFFPNQNIAAGFLGMALIWSVLKRLHENRGSLIVLALLVIGWGSTESRGALISMIFVVVLYLVLHMGEIEDRLSKWKASQWKIFGGIALLVILASTPMVNRLFRAMDTDPRSYFRLDVWASGFKMAMAQPLWGFGPGTFGDVYPTFRPGFLWNTVTPFAHNEYLQVAAECGLPVLALTLLLLWAFLRQTGTGLLQVSAFKKNLPTAQTAECVFYLILFEAAHNFVDFTFHEWSHRLVLIGFTAFALRQNKTGEDLKISLRFSPRAFWTGSAVLLVFIIWILGEGSLRDYLARFYDFKSIVLQQNGDLDGSEVFARKSLGSRAYYMDPWNSLGALEDARAGMTVKSTEREKHFSLAKTYFDKAIQLSPYALTPRENEIQDLVKRGRLEEALDLEKALIDKAPQDPTNYVGLGLILMKMGRPQEVLVPAQKALDLDDYFLPSYLLKANALEAMGKKAEALKVYEEAQAMLKSINQPDPSGQIEPHLQKLQSQP